MKTTFAFALLVGGLFLFQGCKNPCKDVTCLNGGTCDEETGGCQCAAGYEGADCGVGINAKFAGTWTLAQQCTTYTNPDTTEILVAVVPGTTDSITFKGLYFETPFISRAKVSTDGLSFVIHRQVVTTIPNQDFDGSGTISADGSTMTIQYSSYYPIGSNNAVETCAGTFTK